MVFDDGKEVILNNKKFIIHKAPATVAYSAAIEYNMAQESKDASGVMKCIFSLLKYVELELEDGRKVTLDNQEIINQHIKELGTMLELQKAVVMANFTSLADVNP